MSVLGAVAATKSLRDRTQPLDQRVELARNILNGNVSAIIPRKEIVILEWLLDMLAIDNSAKSSLDIWRTLLHLWPATPVEGRQRALKNHKYVTNVIDAISSPQVSSELVDLIVQCTNLMADTCSPVFSFTSENQPGQLLLAYCSCEAALNNEGMGQVIYDSLKSRAKIFGKSKNPVQTLDLVLLEPNDERRHYYLKEFLSSPENPVVPSSFFRVDSVLSAACDVDSPVLSTRIVELSTAFPDFISEIFEISYVKQPTVLNAELISKLLTVAFQNGDQINWRLVDQCLRFNPAALLSSDQDYLSRILEPSSGISDETLAAVITKLTDLRLFPEFIETWNPVNLPMTSIVQSAIMRSLEAVSAVQLVKILNAKPPALTLIIRSLSYQSAALPPVAQELSKLFNNAETSGEMKADILNIQTNIQIDHLNKKDNTYVVLRSVEMGHSKDPESLVSSAAKRFDTDSETNSFILLRYFPLLEMYLGEHRLKKIIKRASHEVRLQLAANHNLLECTKLTTALIETAISKNEIDVLDPIPKQVYTWELRHSAVEKLLSNAGKLPFSSIGKLVLHLLDSQNPPKPDSLAKLLGLAAPNDASLVLGIAQLLKKDLSYNNEVLASPDLKGWQKCCVHCAVGIKDLANNKDSFDMAVEWIRSNSTNTQLIEPILCMLNVMPDTAEVVQLTRNLALGFGSNSSIPPESFPRTLFQLICRQGYDWSVVVAFFVYSCCQFEEDFVEYLKTIDPEKLNQVLYLSASEKQYSVLKSVVSTKLVGSNNNIFTAVIANAAYSDKKSSSPPSFWKLCDVLFREQPTLITQFSLETLLELLASSSDATDDECWDLKCLVASRILLFKRGSLRKRLHLMIAALTSLLLTIKTPHHALTFYRLVDNLCNPPQLNSRNRGAYGDLTSQVAKERRHVARYAGVLLQNIILVIIANTNTNKTWSEANGHLRAASLLLIDLTYGDGLKAVSAGMDSASRAYLRTLFEDYKLHGRWSSDD